MTLPQKSLVMGAVGTLIAALLTGQTIQTDGTVEAQAFTGDGSSLTGVDSELLDGMDSVEFATSTHTHIPAEGEKRKFYFTSGTSDGTTALTACAAGYHMASKWDLRDLDRLSYDNNAAGAFTPPDAGSGEQPPLNYAGWIRTGSISNTGTTPGSANCGNWSTTSNSGTVLFLVASELPVRWDQSAVACIAAVQVWCIED